MTIKAPFPWFGGKSGAAPLVWHAFGDVGNYVEPFAGSLAVLLGRPARHKRRCETVNDLDCYLANFWRALRHDPAVVAHWADWPVNEADLSARHQWLVGQSGFREQMKTDPHFYDVKVAGWWVWGLCAWIGGGWCDAPHLGDPGDPGRGVNRKLPRIGGTGRGVNRKLPRIGGTGRGVLADRSERLLAYMDALSSRLERVLVACGDWTRVLGAGIRPTSGGFTGVLLDPPYRSERKQSYSVETNVADDVVTWAAENGHRPEIRIALCGYEGDYTMPDGWRAAPWKTGTGYQKERRVEVVWLSPHCLTTPAQRSLFEAHA